VYFGYPNFGSKHSLNILLEAFISVDSCPIVTEIRVAYTQD
jgi:hypothetical protein